MRRRGRRNVLRVCEVGHTGQVNIQAQLIPDTDSDSDSGQTAGGLEGVRSTHNTHLDNKTPWIEGCSGSIWQHSSVSSNLLQIQYTCCLYNN